MEESRKYYVGFLGGIENPPSRSFNISLDMDNIVLDCLKVKFFGGPKILSTYKIPFDRVITMEVIAEDNIDAKEQHYQQITGLQTPVFGKTREIINTLIPFNRPNVSPRTVVLSIAYHTAAGEINNITLAISAEYYCGIDAAEKMSKLLRVKLGIEEKATPVTYEQNSKGEFIL